MNKDTDLMVEVWTTASLMEAVLAALLEHPEGLAAAEKLLRRKT